MQVSLRVGTRAWYSHCRNACENVANMVRDGIEFIPGLAAETIRDLMLAGF